MDTLPQILPSTLLEDDATLYREQYEQLQVGKYYYIKMRIVVPDRILPYDYIVKILSKDDIAVGVEYLKSRGLKRIFENRLLSKPEYLDLDPLIPFRFLKLPENPVPDSIWVDDPLVADVLKEHTLADGEFVFFAPR